MTDLFYVKDVAAEKPETVKGVTEKRKLGEVYQFQLWRPSTRNLKPVGVPERSFLVWWLFHQCHIFANRDYSLLTIYENERLVHRSVIFPRYFRFPFMNPNDLQIGDTWTADDKRGQGLAGFALQEVVKAHSKPGRRFWYLVEENNIPSIKVAEKAGFTCIGKGSRTKRFGLKILGAFVMEDRLDTRIT